MKYLHYERNRAIEEKLEIHGPAFKELKIMVGERVINAGTKTKNTYKM